MERIESAKNRVNPLYNNSHVYGCAQPIPDEALRPTYLKRERGTVFQQKLTNFNFIPLHINNHGQLHSKYNPPLTNTKLRVIGMVKKIILGYYERIDEAISL